VQLIYQGKDITSSINIKKADITDNAGGIADSVEMHFNDPKGLWSQWKPQKNDQVKLSKDGFSSGLMYTDELEQQSGVFIIKALSIPQEAKTDNTKSWEKVRFLEFAGEIAGKYGFQLKSYGITNQYYARVDQFEQADFEFLAWRCLLEGYVLKISGQSVIIYDELYMEAQASVKTIHRDQFDGPWKFKSKSTGIYGSCRVTYGDVKGEFKPGSGHTGPILKITNLYVTNQGEAERFAKNLLRAKNKEENTGFCTVEEYPGITAGNVIKIADVGFGDGTYYVFQAVRKQADKKIFLQLRKPLEGY